MRQAGTDRDQVSSRRACRDVVAPDGFADPQLIRKSWSGDEISRHRCGRRDEVAQRLGAVLRVQLDMLATAFGVTVV